MDDFKRWSAKGTLSPLTAQFAEVSSKRAHTSSVGSFTISRFIVALLGMLTAEHEAMDISTLMSSGFLGVSQTVMRLAGTAPTVGDQDKHYDPVSPDGIPYLRPRCGGEEQEEGDISNMIHIGTRVMRGPDWKWGDQDGSTPGKGTIVSELGSDYWIRVRWDTGAVNSYRMIKGAKYDLTVAPEVEPKNKEAESRDAPIDAELRVGMPIPYPAQDMASSLLLQSSICLLRSVVVAIGIHANQLPQYSFTALSKLLHYIMKCAKSKSGSLPNGSLATGVLINFLLCSCSQGLCDECGGFTGTPDVGHAGAVEGRVLTGWLCTGLLQP